LSKDRRRDARLASVSGQRLRAGGAAWAASRRSAARFAQKTIGEDRLSGRWGLASAPSAD
jgi:hypothetical protein